VPEKASTPLCVYLQCLAARGEPAANAAAAPFVGKSSRSNVQRGVLLCGAEYWRESPLERPLIRVVPFSGQIDARSWLSIRAVHNG
jgi:hypothetical protein